jgi:AraC-like DNA-binding protein
MPAQGLVGVQCRKANLFWRPNLSDIYSLISQGLKAWSLRRVLHALARCDTGDLFSMAIAAFLAHDTAEFLEKRIPAGDILFARTWSELDTYVQVPRVSLVLLDPSADGSLRIPAVTAILHRYRTVPVAAYCALRNENFHALLRLWREGLTHVFLHPLHDNGRCLLEMAHRLAGQRLAYEFLGTMETRLVTLEPELLRAIMDLFERPHRYETGADIGRQSGIPVRCVYRAFEKAHLGTPKKFVTVARVLRGYSYLRESQDSVELVSRKLGYTKRRLFSAQITEIFGCSASNLRKESNVGEIKTQLLEWLYRPPKWVRPQEAT